LIILENISEKFDTIIEGQNLLNEKIDRHIDENSKELKEVRNEILHLMKDVYDHRENTEFHINKKKKKAS
jgi:hypothetical protein